MIQHLTDSNFKQTIENNKLVFVDFFATWCGPCRYITPIIEDLSAEYSDQLVIGKIDVDECPTTSIEYGIRSVPTLILFKDGKPVETQIGAINKEKIIAMFSKYLETTEETTVSESSPTTQE